MAYPLVATSENAAIIAVLSELTQNLGPLKTMVRIKDANRMTAKKMDQFESTQKDYFRRLKEGTADNKDFERYLYGA